ncbi:TolC family protein [Flavobacterium caseinilyticum]|uniref:TolC family protein n=1 Tax=Flavobacterium caseinilyticum TaxID=2541732 RepID=A0A4R5B301_9FLAO|nr:TolC family protein [Flavobacterium caseinilyticum]TDD78566.1 TolC family protein [Flavobacterium caseinilyticum]
MKLKNRMTLLVLGLFFFTANAQTSERKIALEEVVQLALENHLQLKLSNQNIQIAKQQIKIVELQKLPTINASANAFYLGDALILDKNFSKLATLNMPHFGNTYGVQASELIFKGGVVNKSIEIAELREQLAELDLEKDQQNIKFLVISNYLDIYKIINQKNVFLNNQKLATERLENVRKFYKQGMVTRNEIIRGELLLKNLQQGILVLDNNRASINYQLTTAIGISPDILVKPTDSFNGSAETQNLQYYLELAHQNHPVLKSAQTGIKMAGKNIEIIGTERMPTVAAFAGYNMARPITANLPVQDLYTNTWQTGLSISYSIDNLYKTKEKVQLGKFQLNQAKAVLDLQLQQLDVQTNAAYLKWQEALKQAVLYKESEALADENYKIVEAKYLNQLALLADMTDATNAKLEAELLYASSEINVRYQYYNLMKTTGTL